jgi:hypothetical protein
MKTIYRELTEYEARELREYAYRYGKAWKAELRTDWCYARLVGPLHSLRNELGGEWLAQYQLPKEQCAACPKTAVRMASWPVEPVCGSCYAKSRSNRVQWRRQREEAATL